MKEDDLVGIYEIAGMAGVTPQAVANWRARFSDFPEPVAILRSGPIFRRDQVRRFLRRKGKTPLATIISTINLKGGVGKTTTTVAIAEVLSVEFRKRVLLIDLDPQTNATAMMIGDERWGEINEEGHTLAQLFVDALAKPEERKFDLMKTRQKRVSNVKDVRSLDLLPSSLDLINVQDQLSSMDPGRFYAENPIELLGRATRRIFDEYHYVLVDCPPNLGIITLNGLRISDGYIIPVIPDRLSTYGIPQIVDRVQDFADVVGKDIEPYGIVVSKYRAQSTVHNNVVRELRKEKDAPLFNTVIPEANQIASSAEYRQVSTLRQKYGSRDGFGPSNYDRYCDLTMEIMEAAEA